MGSSWLSWALVSAVLLGTTTTTPLPTPGDYDPRLSPLELSIIKRLVDSIPGDEIGGGGTSEWTVIPSQSRQLHAGQDSVNVQVSGAGAGEHVQEGGPDDYSLIQVAIGELAPVGKNGRTQADYRVSGEHVNGGGENWTIVKSISTELHLRSKNHDLLDNPQGFQTTTELSFHQEPPHWSMETTSKDLPPRVNLPETPAPVQHDVHEESPDALTSGNTPSKEVQPPFYHPVSPPPQGFHRGFEPWPPGYALSRDELPPFFDDEEDPFFYQYPIDAYPGFPGNPYYPVSEPGFDNGWDDYPEEYNGKPGPDGWENEGAKPGKKKSSRERVAPPQEKLYDIDIRIDVNGKTKSAEPVGKEPQNVQKKIGDEKVTNKVKAISVEIQPPEVETSPKSEKSDLVSGAMKVKGGGDNYKVVTKFHTLSQDPVYDVPVSLREMVPPADNQEPVAFRNEKSYSGPGDVEVQGGGTNYNVIPDVEGQSQVVEYDVPVSLREMVPPTQNQDEITQGSWEEVPLDENEKLARPLALPNKSVPVK